MFLVIHGIPQILDESDTENDNCDGSGSENTTVYSRQWE